MRRFESYLADPLERYLAYRRDCLGYRNHPTRFYLLAFDQYLKNNGPRRRKLSTRVFLEFRAEMNKSKAPSTVNKMLCTLRGLFAFLIRQDLYVHNPLQDIPSLPERWFIPFVFTEEQTNQLLAALCKRLRKRPEEFVTDLAVYMAIVFLARCGMRISEPIRLLSSHYRKEERTVYIEKTKFKKDRLIPLPQSACQELENYLAARKACLGEEENPYLLAGKVGRGLTREQVYRVFRKGVKAIGLEQPRRQHGDMSFGGPTPHSLRHAFAINTLKRIREAGRDPQHALPVLAAYMGHRKYHYTAAYLKVTDPNDVNGLIEFAKSRLDLV
jgi:integrase